MDVLISLALAIVLFVAVVAVIRKLLGAEPVSDGWGQDMDGRAFRLGTIRGLPTQGKFMHAGVVYTIIALDAGPVPRIWPTKYDDRTGVVMKFVAGNGVRVTLTADPMFHTVLDRQWGVGDYYYQEPRSVLHVGVSLDHLPVVSDVADISTIKDDRLRALVRDACQALVAYAASVRAEQAAEVSRQRAEKEQRQREHDRQVDDRLKRL